MLVNCRNCINMRVKVPLKKHNKIMWQKATAKCRQNIIFNDVQEDDKIFKYNTKRWEDGEYIEWQRDCHLFEEA